MQTKWYRSPQVYRVAAGVLSLGVLVSAALALFADVYAPLGVVLVALIAIAFLLLRWKKLDDQQN